MVASGESAGMVRSDLLDRSGQPHLQIGHPARLYGFSDQPLPRAEVGLAGLDLHKGHSVDLLAVVEAIEDDEVDGGAEEPGVSGVEPADELGQQRGRGTPAPCR